MAKKIIVKPKTFPDCQTCRHHEKSDYGLIKCRRPDNNSVVHPNCKAWKVNCVFYEKIPNSNNPNLTTFRVEGPGRTQT